MWWQFFDWHKIGARILYLLFLWYGPTVPCLQENYKLNYLVLRKFRLCALSCISVSVWMPVGDLWHGVTVWKSLYVYSMNRRISSVQFTWNADSDVNEEKLLYAEADPDRKTFADIPFTLTWKKETWHFSLKKSLHSKR